MNIINIENSVITREEYKAAMITAERTAFVDCRFYNAIIKESDCVFINCKFEYSSTSINDDTVLTMGQYLVSQGEKYDYAVDDICIADITETLCGKGITKSHFALDKKQYLKNIGIDTCVVALKDGLRLIEK